MLNYAHVADLMGLPIADTDLLQMIDEQPASSDTPTPEGLKYFNFPKTGLEVITRGFTQNISTVLFYGPKYDANHDAFQGELPEDIAFGESLQSIEQKLGTCSSRAVTDKPDVDEKLFLRLRYQRVGHLLDLVLDEVQCLFLVRLLAIPQPPRI